MEQEFEIFKQAEKKFYNNVSPLVSKIKELIFQNKQHADEKDDNIQFTIMKSLKYYSLKKFDATIYQKVSKKLKRDFKGFDLDFSINFNTILTIENKNMLDDAWCEYNKTIEPIILETWKRMFIPYQSSLPFQDFKDIRNDAMINLLDALPNYDYRKSKLITYVSYWNKIKNNNNDITFSPDVMDLLKSNEDLEKDEIDIDTKLCIEEYMNNNLDERRRLLILKHFYKGKQLNEIARQFEISKPRVSAILKKLLKKLKKELIDECF